MAILVGWLDQSPNDRMMRMYFVTNHRQTVAAPTHYEVARA